MAEELTTEMHYEFFEGRVTKEDFLIASVYGAIRRGIKKNDALKQHGLTEDFYDRNIHRVLYESDW